MPLVTDDWHDLVGPLKDGGVGVIPTDTIYGLVGSALDERVVERIYALKDRSSKKPLIVLIAGEFELARFGVELNAG